MKNLCMNCMKPLEENGEICPCCGESTSAFQKSPFLPFKTLLAKRYVVGKGVEMDGEGLSYVGYDCNKESKIYIREFFPSNFCLRENNLKTVQTVSDTSRLFKGLLTGFIKYFKSVARLRNLPAVTSVYDIFEENGTAYVIMQWFEGVSLGKYLSEKGGYLNWSDAKKLFMPVIASLSHMEVSGVRHLGIYPENMIVTPENEIKITGFATKSLRSANSNISSQLYDGCSALEQYLDDYEPSESTDVYGFGATLFLALTGEYPLSAFKRKQNDKLMMPQNILENLPEHVISALANALRVYPNNRTISFETLRIELSDSPVLRMKDIEESDSDFSYNESIKNSVREDKKSSGAFWGIISCAIALVLLLGCLGVYWFWLRGNSPSQKPAETGTPQTSEPASPGDDTSNKAPQKIAVPNVIGKNFKSFQEENALNSKYKLVLLSEEFSDTIEEGNITSQTPNYGEEMNEGSTIAVNVSKGKQKRTLPNISGKSLSEASQILTDLKLKPTQSSEFSSEFSEGTVIGYKSYKPNDTIDYGSEIVIVVSKGKA